MTSLAHRGFVHLGMDVSRDSISVAVLHPDRDVAVVDKILIGRRVGPPARQKDRTARWLVGLLRSRPHRLRPLPPAHEDGGPL